LYLKEDENTKELIPKFVENQPNNKEPSISGIKEEHKVQKDAIIVKNSLDQVNHLEVLS